MLRFPFVVNGINNYDILIKFVNWLFVCTKTVDDQNWHKLHTFLNNIFKTQIKVNIIIHTENMLMQLCQKLHIK
jgi:hypothetical protein